MIKQIAGISFLYPYGFNKLVTYIFCFISLYSLSKTLFAGNAPTRFKIKMSVLLFYETYHHGTIQIPSIEISHYPGIKAPFIVFGLSNNFHCFRLWSAGYGAGRQEPEKNISDM